MTTIVNDTQVNSIVQLCKQIAEDSNKPMSIDQIIAKFNPRFPFRVQRVCGTSRAVPTKHVVMVIGESDGQHVCLQCGARFTFQGYLVSNLLYQTPGGACKCRVGATEANKEQWALI